MIYSGLLSGCARSILLILVASVGSDDLNINNQLKPREHALLCRSQDIEVFKVQFSEHPIHLQPIKLQMMIVYSPFRVLNWGDLKRWISRCESVTGSVAHVFVTTEAEFGIRPDPNPPNRLSFRCGVPARVLCREPKLATLIPQYCTS